MPWLRLAANEVARVERGEFALVRHFWRGQIVIRFGPSSEYYDLVFRAGETIQHFLVKDDPRQTDGALAYAAPGGTDVTLEGGAKKSLLEVTDRVALQPEYGGDTGNPTKATPAWVERVDGGRVLVLEDSADFKKLELFGQALTGAWTLAREGGASGFWAFQHAAGPDLAQSRVVPIFKADTRRRVIYAVVMEPNEVDAQGHYAQWEEITDALHFWALNSQLMDHQHERTVPPEQAAPVEFLQVPVDIEWPVDDAGTTVHIKAGSWVQGTKIFDPVLWGEIERGEINAYSIRGWGRIRHEQTKPTDINSH